MHRLVIALTSLIALIGVAVVGVHLFLGGAAVDRAAALAPASSAFYLNVYLQPSAGQQQQLASVLSRLPGFEDTAAIDTKIDELAQNLVGEAGIDYRATVKPWLGNQIAIAGGGELDEAGNPTEMLVIAAVKDEALAGQAIASIVPDGGAPAEETYKGLTVRTAGDATYAIVDGMLVAGQSVEVVQGAIDVAQGRADALADLPAFAAAMRTLPQDHLASAWLDLRAVSATGVGTAEATDMAGLSTLAMALLAEEAGFRLVGQLPVDPDTVGDAVRDALGAGAEAARLPDSMPGDTEISLVLFNLRAALERAEIELDTQGSELSATVDQLRALAAFGLGIDIDADLLPLLDGEVGAALRGIASGTPGGALLLRPTDPATAADGLDRVASALESRGSAIQRTDVAGVEVVTVEVPQAGSVSWAAAGDLVVLGLTPEDVAAVLDAGDGGDTLGAGELYRSTFAGAERRGTELFINLNPFVPLALAQAGEGIPPDAAAILEHLESFGIVTPTRPDRFEFHATLTIR